MKLLRLHINSAYGSINEGFKLQFRDPFEKPLKENLDWTDFHPFCFAGLNGSGKSNVLEALSNIFYHIECCANVKQPDIFQDNFLPEICKPNAFELEYYISLGEKRNYNYKNLIRVCITKKEKNEEEGEDGLPVMTYQHYPFNDDPSPATVVAEKYAEKPAPAKQYLPDLVIGYSSGENEILSIPFLKSRLLHFDEYLVQLKEGARYKKPESSLVYIDYEMSQAVLLSNFIFQSKKVLKPLNDELGIKDISRFRINLNLHAEGKHKILDQYWDVIEAFKRCATTCYQRNDKLTLDFWINAATKKAFKKNFPEGIFQLFQAFQILYTLNHRTVTEEIKSDVYQSKGFYTDGKVPIPAPEKKVFYFLDYYIKKGRKNSRKTVNLLMKNLSDGEQQFLHTMGICLMLENKSALILLDEPETHFNPDWRSKFIRTLKKSLDASKSNHLMKDILITSHSPFIISDCLPDKVLLFGRKKRTNNVICTRPKFNTFGASVGLILEEIFGRYSSIGDLAKERLENILEDVETREELIQARKQIFAMGESLDTFEALNKINHKLREGQD